jgi:hypothetical protein
MRKSYPPLDKRNQYLRGQFLVFPQLSPKRCGDEGDEAAWVWSAAREGSCCGWGRRGIAPVPPTRPRCARERMPDGGARSGRG